MKLKKITRAALIFVCLSLYSGLPVACAGAPPRPNPITYYNPYTGQAEPFYPYGWDVWYDVCVDHSFFDNAGGNTLLLHLDGNQASYDAFSRIFDMARSHGKKVIVDFVSPAFFSGETFNPYDINNYGAMAWYIDRAKNDPALLGWMLGDENEYNFPAADVVNGVNAINTLDGHHQVWQNFNGFGYNSQHEKDPVPQELPYLPGTAVYCADAYPFHLYDMFQEEPNSFLNVEWWCNPFYVMGQTAAANGTGCALMPQGFGQVDTEFAGQALIDGMWRLPTRKEHRWQVFASIVAMGSRGTLNWLYEPRWYSDPNLFYNWRDNIANPVFAEQAMIARGMVSGYNVGTVAIGWTNKSSDQSGSWTLEYDRVTQLLLYDDVVARYFLIATNNGTISQTMDLTISNLPVPLANLNVLAYREGGTSSGVLLTDFGGGVYELVDTLQCFDVVIYRIDAVPTTCAQAAAQNGAGLAGDLNGDCYVNFADLAVFAQDWTRCVDTQSVNCL
ncbi:MAG: hypothetical protein ACYC54_11435 [Sedimentisphaerales bacterium]